MKSIHDAIKAEADKARNAYALPFEKVTVSENPSSVACAVLCFGEWAFAPSIAQACEELRVKLTRPYDVAREKRARAATLLAEAEQIERAATV